MSVVVPSFQECAFSAYIAAYDHAQRRSRCAHVSCGVLIDGILVGIATNTPVLHAEMEALKMLSEQKISESSTQSSEKKDWVLYFERGHYQPRSKGVKDRPDRCALQEEWGVGHGQAMFGMSACDSGLWDQVCVF
jgi:hypothetical protein